MQEFLTNFYSGELRSGTLSHRYLGKESRIRIAGRFAEPDLGKIILSGNYYIPNLYITCRFTISHLLEFLMGGADLSV